MTLISALISINGTAVATDSVLTIRKGDKSGSFAQVEWQLPKLVRLQKFSGTISFWGDAVAEPKHPIVGNGKSAEFNWTLYDWLTEKCKNTKEANLEDFVKRLTSEIKNEYAIRKWSNYGLGLHVTGYELIKDTHIPELFLISNYANTDYNSVRDFSYSRESFHAITSTPPEAIHRDPIFRMVVNEYLLNGGLLIYNNGDPNLFNPVFKTISDTYQYAKGLGKVKEIKTPQNLVALVKRPIEIVSKFQSDFFKEDKILIGGKIHDLAVWRDGNYFSTSGD